MNGVLRKCDRGQANDDWQKQAWQASLARTGTMSVILYHMLSQSARISG